MSEIEAPMVAALVKAQAELSQLTLRKTGQNPHFRNRYIPLEELIDEIVPVLNKHGFALVQKPSVHDGQPALMYELLHTSGGRIGGEMLLMSAKESPQDQGSAITYARRYSLMSLLGIAADPDDDGNAASKPQERQFRPTPAGSPVPNGAKGPMPSTTAQQGAIRASLQGMDEATRNGIIQSLKETHPHIFAEDGKAHFSKMTLVEAIKFLDGLKRLAPA